MVTQLRYVGHFSSGILGIPITSVSQLVLVVSADDIWPGECSSWVMRVQDGS